ncbi:hypothetical protein ACFL9U_08845 [Thermodesulfobacteriota bacterium]
MNKILALLVLPIFVCWIYIGVNRGQKFGEIDENRPMEMRIIKVLNAAERWILPDYQAIGSINEGDSTITVSIYLGQYESLKPGDLLKVYELPNEPGTFIDIGELQGSQPMFHIGGFSFSWHFLGGMICVPFLLFYIFLYKK